MFLSSTAVYNYQTYIKGVFFPGAEKLFDNLFDKGKMIQMNSETGLDAIISAFIRYPEMSSIKYEAKNNYVAMEMILKGHIVDKQQSRFTERTRIALNLFYKLRKISPHHLVIKFISRNDITVLEFSRDNISLSEEEIELFILLVSQEFSTVLITDVLEHNLNDVSCHEFKKSVMRKINSERHPYQKVFAYRDGGKMFVYDK